MFKLASRNWSGIFCNEAFKAHNYICKSLRSYILKYNVDQNYIMAPVATYVWLTQHAE